MIPTIVIGNTFGHILLLYIGFYHIKQRIIQCFLMFFQIDWQHKSPHPAYEHC